MTALVATLSNSCEAIVLSPPLHYIPHMKKKYRRPLLIFLALIFLFESWLWEKTGAAVAWALKSVPIEDLAKRAVAKIQTLTPVQTLGVFVIPALVLLPLKFIALWLLSQGFIFSGITTIAFAKLAGFGVTSFLFTLCKPKLLQMRWVRWLYDHCIYWRGRAHELVKPYTRFVKQYMKAVKPQSGRANLLTKLRARMHKLRQPAE